MDDARTTNETQEVEYCAKCGAEAPAGWSENCGGCGNPFIAHPDPDTLFPVLPTAVAEAHDADPGAVPEDDIDAEIEAIREEGDLAASIAGVKSAVEGAHKRLDELIAPDGDRVAALSERVDRLLIGHQEGIGEALRAHSEQAAKLSDDVLSLTAAMSDCRDILTKLIGRVDLLEDPEAAATD